MRKPRLTDEVVEWAYDKWLDGYSVLAIAKAIGCTDATLTARFDRAGYIREKPPLRVPQGMKVREGENGDVQITNRDIHEANSNEAR